MMLRNDVFPVFHFCAESTLHRMLKEGAAVKGILCAEKFENAWNCGLSSFAVRHMNCKRNQMAQTIKLRMFGPVNERRVNNDAVMENTGLGLKPYRATHDEISAWVEAARKLLPV